MSKAKQELTPAEKYRQIKNDRLSKETLVDFVSPSGMEWKLRRPNLQQFVFSGILPVSLAATLVKASEEGQSETEAFASLAIEEQVRTVEFSQTVVRYCAVVPRIVDHPQTDDEIAASDVEPDDFQAILGWAMGGGKTGEQLESFRQS